MMVAMMTISKMVVVFAFSCFSLSYSSVHLSCIVEKTDCGKSIQMVGLQTVERELAGGVVAMDQNIDNTGRPGRGNESSKMGRKSSAYFFDEPAALSCGFEC
eukprot:Gb_27860 [translate_table: standard]